MNIGGKLHRVHRLACELIHGEPTQERPHALHKCNNRLCVNPFHLYWGNDAMNARDRQAAGTAKGRNPSHCKWGHEFTEANTYWEPRGWGRACKACGIRRLGESRARAKARA